MTTKTLSLVSKEHCHPPDTQRKELIKAKEVTKEMAKQSGEITSSIINKCTGNYCIIVFHEAYIYIWL